MTYRILRQDYGDTTDIIYQLRDLKPNDGEVPVGAQRYVVYVTGSEPRSFDDLVAAEVAYEVAYVAAEGGTPSSQRLAMPAVGSTLTRTPADARTELRDSVRNAAALAKARGIAAVDVADDLRAAADDATRVSAQGVVR